MQTNEMNDKYLFFSRFLNHSYIFGFFMALGAITPAFSNDSEVFYISSDTFSIGETWVYRDSSVYRRSDLGGLVGVQYIYGVYHKIMIKDKLNYSDSSFYICEIVDSGIINFYAWNFVDAPFGDTMNDSILYTKQIDTLCTSPFSQLWQWAYSIDSFNVQKCIYKSDTLYINEKYLYERWRYLEKYGFFYFRNYGTTNTTFGSENIDLISHNGILFDTSAILPLNSSNRISIKNRSPKKAAEIFLSTNSLIISDPESNSTVNPKSYALYSIDGRLLQKGFYKNNAKIDLHFKQTARSLIVRLGTGSSFSVIRRD